MSTAVADNTKNVPSRSGREAETPRYKLGFGGVLKSEFLKFRTLISSWVLMIVTFVLMVGFAALAAWLTTDMAQSAHNVPQEAAGDPQASAMYTEQAMQQAKDFAFQSPAAGITFAYLILASLAVVIMAGEFGTKSIVSTFSAAPRRGTVFLAKTIVMSVVSVLIAVVSMVVGWAVAQLILSTHDGLTFGLFDEKFLFNILGVSLIFMLTSWMGLGFGALFRNNAGAIVLVVGILFVLPIVILFFQQWDWAKTFTHYLPQNLAGVLSNPNDPKDPNGMGADDGPGYVAAGVWYLVWSAVPLLLGYLSFTQRDPK